MLLNEKRVRRVDIVVYDGVDELDVFGPNEVLVRAARAGVPLEVQLACPRAQAVVTGAHGIEFAVHGDYDWRPDVLVVPGGGWNARSGAGAWAEVQRADWLPSLWMASRSAELTVGVCTGSLVLAASGVLAGRSAATHHSAREDLAAYGVEVSDARVCDDGDLITSGGVTSGIDAALHLVRRLAGTPAAAAIAEAIEYAWTPAALTGAGKVR